MNIYSNYFEWTLKEKVNYWDDFYINGLDEYNEKDTFKFIKKVIIDDDEKVFCKRRALQELLVLVYKEQISVRKIIGFLLDDWDGEQDASLECLRLKYLSLFIQKEKEDIKKILVEKKEDKDYEIKSEANYQLGLIKVFEANDIYVEEEYKKNMMEAELLFEASKENDDNRIDAEILMLICKYLVNSMCFNSQQTNELYKQIMSLIWEKAIFSFNEPSNQVYVGISRSISKLEMIKMKDVEKWLDYRKEFNNLCLQFYELKNVDYKEDFYHNKIINDVSNNLVEHIVEPIFKYNYKSTISKIDVLLELDDISDKEKKFLMYLKRTITNDNISSQNINFNFMKSIYPRVKEEDIENFKKQILGPNKEVAIYEFMKCTKRYSYEGLLDSIIIACIKLQGNHMYRKASEDDRNGFIRDLLDSMEYSTKDQTRWGTSNTGKSAGEIDIMVYENNTPYAVIEAMNLSALSVEYINTHINKIFGYDTTGLQYNYVISYVTAKNFSSFWEKYKIHVREHKYKYELIGFDDSIDNEFHYSDIKVALTKHNRSGNIVNLYHICVKIPE